MSGVVIGVGAAIGAVIGGGSGLYSASKSNRNQIKAFKKQMYYMQLNYNYNQAALNRQERSLYDSAMSNLFNLSMNAFQNQSQVEAAQAESGVEGRTQDKLSQVIRGTNLRQETALKNAYEVDVWNVRSQKEALYIETKNAVEQARDNLSNSFIKGSKLYSHLFSSITTGAAMGALTAGVGSALGGALGGAASSTVGSTAVNATGSGALVAGGVNTSLGAGFLSSAGFSTASTATAATAGAGASSTAMGLGAGALAVSGASTGASTATTATTSSSVMSSLGRGMQTFQQYKPYIDMMSSWANFVNDQQYRMRGGYAY